MMRLLRAGWAKFHEWFHNNVNWCEGTYYGTDEEKPWNAIYYWFYQRWLFPLDQNACLCCNSVRSLIYGAIIGAILGWKVLLIIAAVIILVIAIAFIWSIL